MKNSINETLKIKLICKPAPRFNKTEFKQLYDRICSNPDDIVSFLDAEDTGKKTEIAKRIIDTMILESNFPPTSNILDNLAIFEQTVRSTRSVENKSRDHYIHICYLYFLGIFLFFYNQDFNEKLHGTLTLVKQKVEISEERNFVKSFLSAWKYFVLYHDIAYPFEYLGNENNQYNAEEVEMKGRVEEIFSPTAICESVLNQIALKVLSTIMAVRYVINKKSSKATYLFNYLKRNGDKYINFDNNLTFMETLIEAEADKNFEIMYLQYIKSGDDIKFFYTIFDRKDFFIVFKHNSSLECIAYKGEIYVLENVRRKRYIQKLLKNKELIFSDEIYLQYPQLEIEYYGVDLKKRLDAFLDFNKIEPAHFEIGLPINKKCNRMKEIVREYYFVNCDVIETKASKRNKIEKLQADIANRIFKQIKEQIEIDISTESFEDNENSYAIQYAEEYIQEIKRIMPAMDRQCGEKIGMVSVHDTMVEYDGGTEIRTIHKLILDDLKEMEIDINCAGKNVWEKYNIENISKEISECDKETNNYIGNSLRKATNAPDNKTVFGILSSYHLTYSQYDHGIVAAGLYLKYWSCYQGIIKRNKDFAWIRVGFNIPLIDDDDMQQKYIQEKYIDDYKGVIGQIAYAILVHNLYPKCFSEPINGISTNILVNPFAYFCMVSDMLQNWGRPYNINPIKENNPLFLDSKEYNIIIDNYITLQFLENDPKVISKRLKNFGEELDTYLLDASEMIRTSFDNIQ